MKSILITGGAGFIGSNFIPFILKKFDSYKIINVDKLTYAGDLKNLDELKNHSRYFFEKIDICDNEEIAHIFKKYEITDIIHFAAESHVDNSIKNPDTFVKTNVLGTNVLLNSAFNSWMDKPFEVKNKFRNSKFIHVSTDEVFGSLGEKGSFKETTPYAPNSPYSASKASSDFIVKSYFHTFGLNISITNCSNNYGPKQHNEKFIPTIIRNALNHQPIPIYGDGENIRDWLYVEDHYKGVLDVFLKGKSGETYNIGGNNEYKNIDIATIICNYLDEVLPTQSSYNNLITFVNDRFGHDRRYAIDSTKIQKELNWRPIENFNTGIKKTINWYISKYKID